MNKQLIIYMLQKIIYKQEILQLEQLLKEMILFFVLQLQVMMLLNHKHSKMLIFSNLSYFKIKFQFFISGASFFVLAPATTNFNSLYRAPNSLKIKK